MGGADDCQQDRSSITGLHATYKKPVFSTGGHLFHQLFGFVVVEGDAAVMAAVAEHRDYLMSETLASAWQKPKGDEFVATQEQGEARWVIRLARDRGVR